MKVISAEIRRSGPHLAETICNIVHRVLGKLDGTSKT
jgi:hypothetical protein